MCDNDRLTWQVIEAQKQARKQTDSTNNGPRPGKQSNANADEDDDNGISYSTPQTFVKQLFKLYDEGLVDDENMRDQVFLMVNVVMVRVRARIRARVCVYSTLYVYFRMHVRDCVFTFSLFRSAVYCAVYLCTGTSS